MSLQDPATRPPSVDSGLYLKGILPLVILLFSYVCIVFTVPEENLVLVELPYTILFTYCINAVFAKRFHDLGQSGWWLLFPIASFIFVLIALFRPTQPMPNKYAPATNLSWNDNDPFPKPEAEDTT